jgi:hypothetical protein
MRGIGEAGATPAAVSPLLLDALGSNGQTGSLRRLLFPPLRQVSLDSGTPYGTVANYVAYAARLVTRPWRYLTTATRLRRVGATVEHLQRSRKDVLLLRHWLSSH